MSGSKASAVCRMIEARSARVSSTSMSRLCEVYSPSLSLITPGTRTKSTRGRKSKLPMIGEPERMRTDMPEFPSTSEWAIALQRRRWPSPKLSWL